MGLCKCPKKKVTNLFCYEHRVNVCQYCMVKQHSKCVVQSYLLWLNDSEYNPICTICSTRLINEDCVRLICLHIFHWRCLDRRCRRLPSTTAPAGFTCPTCDEPIIPPSNVAMPIADELRDKLHTVNWARGILGLPCVSTESYDRNDSCSIVMNPADIVQDRNSSNNDENNDSVHYIDESAYSRSDETAPMPRRMTASASNIEMPFSQEDDKKDRRISRFLSVTSIHRYLCHRLRKQNYLRRCRTIILFLVCVMLMTILFSTFGQISQEEDLTLDPMHNPHVHLNNK